MVGICNKWRLCWMLIIKQALLSFPSPTPFLISRGSNTNTKLSFAWSILYINIPNDDNNNGCGFFDGRWLRIQKLLGLLTFFFLLVLKIRVTACTIYYTVFCNNLIICTILLDDWMRFKNLNLITYDNTIVNVLILTKLFAMREVVGNSVVI